MKRASYREAIEYIALNDDAGSFSLEDILAAISVQLVSCLFEVEADKVAADVLRRRSREWPEDAKRAADDAEVRRDQ